MKIAIDISQIVYEGTGVGRFTQGLVDGILENSKEHNWIFFYQTLRRSIPQEMIQKISDKGFSYRNLMMPPTIGNIVWNKMHFVSIDPLIHGADWYISSDWTEPPSRKKKATIVHDLIFKRYPETVDASVKAVMESKVTYAVKECKVIFADSETTKNDLHEYYKVPDKKVVVNYPGVSALDYEGSSSAEVKKKYKLHKPYFITVGKQEPRKNIDRLLQAFRQLNRDDIELLVVGQAGWGEQLTSFENVRFLGYVPDNELHYLYAESSGMVFPSLYEGFGYPAVEAMLAETPVALSNTSSLKEIGKDAGIFFEPENIDSITDAMFTLLEPSTRKKLVDKAKSKAEHYTWEKYYDTLIRTLEAHS